MTNQISIELSAESGPNLVAAGVSQQGGLAVLLQGPRTSTEEVTLWGHLGRVQKEKGVEGLIWILGKVQEQGRVLTGGLRFENSWEQEIRGHCEQRVRTGITEESVNASKYKARRRC